MALHRARVEDNSDPEGAGRIQVSAPALGEAGPAWAVPCVPYAPGHGLLVLPPVGTEVWIEFEDGDSTRPIWTGALWDPDSAPSIADEVKLAHSSGSSVTFTPSGVTVETPSKLDMAASTVEISAGTMTVLSGMVRVEGVVQCETLIANSVVASSYTPGTGNLE